MQGNALKSWPKALIMVSIMLLVTGAVYMGGFKVAILSIIACVAAPIVLATIWKTKIGIYILVTVSFFLSVALRLIPQLPMGMSIDILVLLMIVGKGYQFQFNRDWSPLKSPLTTVLVVWIVYNLSQIVNPWAGSRAAWFYVIRPAVGYLMLYFMIWDSVKSTSQAKSIFDYILFLAFLAGLWGIYQSFFGYFDWEMQYILRNDTVHLVFNDGRWRSFGPIGSPAQYGIVMAIMCCMALNYAFKVKGFIKIAWYLLVSIVCLLAMTYSGTRASFVILPIFYFAKVFISRNRKLYYSIVFMVLGLVVLATIPTNNYQILRIQSVFKASEDKSFQTRSANRKMITPWIIKHPIGGGLGSTGTWGQRFSPGTFLANFPPDSGIIRVAVELGWIGLIIFLSIYGIAFLRGVQGLWKMENQSNKAVVESIICILPALVVVELGQEVVGVFPMSLLFWALLAILFSTIRYDKNEA